MTEKYEEKLTEEEIVEAYIHLWASQQGALHPIVKELIPLVRRSLQDPEYRARLIEDTQAALKEADIGLDDKVEIRIVEDNQTVRHLVLPPLIDSVPKARMRIFRGMISSGSFGGGLSVWFQDDSNSGDVDPPAGVDIPGADGTDKGDKGKDNWHPF